MKQHPGVTLSLSQYLGELPEENDQQYSCSSSSSNVWSASAWVVIMVLKACDTQHFYPRAFHMKEVKTAIYCCLHRCSALLLWSASPCPPSSSLAHDKRVIDSETDTLGCFLAAYQQQSLSSSFRSLSGLMKDRRWNSMAVIATVAPSPPSSILYVTTQLSLFPTNSGIKSPQCWSHMRQQQCHIFWSFCSISVGPLCAGASDVSGTICKYLWVCFTCTRTPQLILF